MSGKPAAVLGVAQHVDYLIRCNKLLVGWGRGWGGVSRADVEALEPLTSAGNHSFPPQTVLLGHIDYHQAVRPADAQQRCTLCSIWGSGNSGELRVTRPTVRSLGYFRPVSRCGASVCCDPVQSGVNPSVVCPLTTSAYNSQHSVLMFPMAT
ncbi:hypothetical protein JZ751_028592 [Albula glossodonta]|uniref:Uncharacterized protein n=1 Tax=Albula glossodonta TaxID=121402 RepID=A0A8T2NIT1_9TELE|nr:hypothetical protein JZ751_028592 [Albula glossodonta]